MMGRRLAVAGLLGSVLLLAAGTGGFSAMSADRSVEVAVVDDSRAVLGVDITCEDGNAVRVTVTNRFRDTDDMAVEVASGGTERTIAGLGPGEADSVTFGGGAVGDTVAVNATGERVTVTLTRAVPDECVDVERQDGNESPGTDGDGGASGDDSKKNRTSTERDAA